MSEKRAYLDTSAYLGILLGASQAMPFVKAISVHILCSSTLLLIEAERNLIRLVRQKEISEAIYEEAFDQLAIDREGFVLRDLTPDLCLTRNFPAVRTPKSADLIHLRTGKWFLEHGGLNLFLSLDKDQLRSAGEFGLPIF